MASNDGLKIRILLYFPDYKLRFFLATAEGRLILRCNLCADKFIGTPVNLGQKPFGYWLYPSGLHWRHRAMRYAGTTQTKSPVHGWGIWSVQDCHRVRT